MCIVYSAYLKNLAIKKRILISFSLFQTIYFLIIEILFRSNIKWVYMCLKLFFVCHFSIQHAKNILFLEGHLHQTLRIIWSKSPTQKMLTLKKKKIPAMFVIYVVNKQQCDVWEETQAALKGFPSWQLTFIQKSVWVFKDI